jgi:hypothetical protein
MLRQKLSEEDIKERTLMRYHNGTVYYAKNAYIDVVMPVDQPIVIVVPDTNSYRRLAAIHSTVGDRFLEIGCDFGKCTKKVYKALADVSDVLPLSSSLVTTKSDDNVSSAAAAVNEERGIALGIDKSEESIRVAKEECAGCGRYEIADALLDYDGVLQLCTDYLGRHPTVVAIDINGNREAEAVVQTIDNVMNMSAKPPRLIVVKSSMLCAAKNEEVGK